MNTAAFLSVPSTSLLSIVIAMEKWPRLEGLPIILDDSNLTTKEEATQFLSAVGRHDHLQVLSLWGRGTPQCRHFRRLLDRNAYPSSVRVHTD